jgi:hypothetical protein
MPILYRISLKILLSLMNSKPLNLSDKLVGQAKKE